MMQPDSHSKKPHRVSRAPKVPRPGAAFGIRPGSPRSAEELPAPSAEQSSGYATGSETAWTPDVTDFDGLSQEDWYDYVLAACRAYDNPSIRTIMRQARKREKGCTLGRGTIHSALRGDNWPTAQTAYWLGIGIGGHPLGTQFRNGWLAADGTLRKDVHEVVMSKALVLRGSPELRMERRERRQEERRQRAERQAHRRRGMRMIVATVVTMLVGVIELVVHTWGWHIFVVLGGNLIGL